MSALYRVEYQRPGRHAHAMVRGRPRLAAKTHRCAVCERLIDQWETYWECHAFAVERVHIACVITITPIPEPIRMEISR